MDEIGTGSMLHTTNIKMAPWGVDWYSVELAQKKLIENLWNQLWSLRDFKMNLYPKKFTFYAGDIKSLPKGATSLDFAFAYIPK
jgi:GTP pyrophosphokinase